MNKILLIISLLGLVACGPHTDYSSDIQMPHRASEAFATYRLQEWFNSPAKNAVPAMYFDSIESEYTEYLRDIAFLRSDSVRDLKIDCIGVLHFSRDLSGELFPDAAALTSQSELEALLKQRPYDIIASEHSALTGKITFEQCVAENIKDVKSVMPMVAPNIQLDMAKTARNVRKSLLELTSVDYQYRLLKSGSQKPYLIGTEPRWAYLANQYFMDQLSICRDPALSNTLTTIYTTLAACRSEIAVARTARYLLSQKKPLRVVLIYGSAHVPDFQRIKDTYGIIGTITNLGNK